MSNVAAGKEARDPWSCSWEADVGLRPEEALVTWYLPLGQGKHLGLRSERHRLGAGCVPPSL